ncbi:3-hydroxybutyrate oligomer hydrolase family protein [Luteimonas sp. RD2P54]|uniref:3-hydroxybutyrate oligomer hydrolase family protein n=1 Tax=Luteimonas endophytica TaxID=3042023 RepID=A0ABT6J9K3_9GAMM|nr:3-hydroxybutyrate oligomer hydrolase family protein [Luteimonas endophytica]MDH5823486.1 3-hydroxybutyrate oligomer hydrolase family protein [Luteimonas endophytica]
MSSPLPRVPVLAAALLLVACAAGPRRPAMEPAMFTEPRASEHRGADDLLSAGLGPDGLRAMAPPPFADPENPTRAERRRRALWSNWRGIADLAPGGGYGEVYGSLAPVPGREFHAMATLPGARHPHRVMLQLPDGFDQERRCLVVTASSGSRGVYGSIAVAGAWGLPRGCAVAYTDKGAGTDYFDLDGGLGVDADGGVAAAAQAAFAPDAAEAATGVAVKHAHSQDNPEADWGRHLRQAAEFALRTLDEALPQAAPFTFDNTRVIAVGLSNGGGAVLRAAELEGEWLDAAVAGAPNVLAAGEGARALYDYTTEAALLMPCALAHPAALPKSPLSALAAGQRAPRCAALAEAGLVEGEDTPARARSAWERLRAQGWTEEALQAGALSVDFDLWRAVAVTYASAYGRYRAGEHPCGYGFAAQQPDFAPRPATAAERAAWWSDGSGIPPGGGVGIVDPRAAAPDPALPGLRCLRALWDGAGADAARVRAGVEATRAGAPRRGLPLLVVHGLDDGLIPVAFSSAPYVAAARAAGREVSFWQVRNAQHFDAFLGLPDYAARYVPLLPYLYAALDRIDAHLDGAAAMPADATISPAPRAAGGALDAESLALPH